jgi:hypothetical protein
MKKAARTLLGLAVLTLAGCASPDRAPSSAGNLSSDERSDMQSRVFAASVDTVFASTVAVLQDRDWKILKADRASGIIQAESRRRVEAISPKEEDLTNLKTRQKIVEKRDSAEDQWTRWDNLTVHIEPWGNQVRERITMSRFGELPPMAYKKYIGASWASKGREVMVNAPAREESVEVLFPEVYEEFFGQIEKAIAVRQSQLQQVGK